MEDNSLDFELAKSVGSYFQLKNNEMDKIIKEIRNSVSKWNKVADDIGISRAEKSLMGAAFRV